MSILANLLKKTETSQSRAEIPPGVLQAVSSSAGSSERDRYYLVGGLALVAIAVGAGLGFYLNSRPAPARLATQPPAIPSSTVVVQPPVSSATRPAVPSQQLAAPVPASLTKEPAPTVSRHTRSKSVQTVKRSTAGYLQPVPQAVPERKAVPKDRSIVDAHLFAARNAEARGDYLAALRQYRQAIDADPDNYRIMNNMASTMLQLGMYDEALTVANRALAIKPDYVSALVNAGIAQGGLGHGPAARGMLSRAVILDPGNRSALYNLALAQERAGMLDDALKSFRRLADGGDPQGYLGQGRLFERQGNKAEALKLYRELTALPEGGQRPKDLARERIKLLEE
ncbi:MAG: tetratricopeptide repeat protein [Trichlorobacter sp.]|jgi:Tfp pilus assembly protein PilF